MPVSLKDVHQKIQTISKTSSTLEKIDLLRKYLLTDPLFRIVIKAAYMQTVKYNVKSFPDYKQVGFCDRGWKFVLPILKQLASQQGADNAIKQKLFQAASIDRETYSVVERICNKDLKGGFGGILINKAVPGTVKLISYMRCSTSKFLHKINYPALGNCKADGAFANLVIENGNRVTFITRSGRVVKCLQHLKSMIKNPPPGKMGMRKGIDHDKLNMCSNHVYQGELRVWNEDGTIMSRKAGNGIINECIHGTVDPEIAKRIFYTAWDCVTIPEFQNGYSERVFRTREFVARSFVDTVGSKFIQYIKSQVVNSEEEAFLFYRKLRSEGEEGAIIKNYNGIWEDNQSGSHDCIKIKHSFECELKVVGWNYGTKGGKWEHTVGSIQCESECGKLKVNISGLLDEEREWEWDLMIGTIVTVEAESVIESKSKKGVYSLYTPSFVEVREDRAEADSLERIIEISKESQKTKRRKA